MDARTAAAASTEIVRAYARGVETRDAELLASLYADDCEHMLINRNAPPSHPHVLRGRQAVAAMWREDCARDMTHRVESSVAEGGRFALHVSCLHPDGTRVSSMIFAEVEGNRIRRETAIDCWDE